MSRPTVCDATGAPLVVWRGEASGELFDTFDVMKTRCQNGFFFSEERELAQGYAGRGTQPRAFHLAAERILDLRHECHYRSKPEVKAFIEDLRSSFEEWVDRYSGEPTELETLLEMGYLYDYEGTGSGERWNELFAIARSHGFDAVVTPDSTDGVPNASVWVVFDPNQITLVASPAPAPPLTAKPRWR